jgi:two-component system nitrogen regulation response regulator NtrX
MTDSARRQGRVLIVDDEESVRDMLSKVLEYENYEPAEAADGSEALAAMGGGDFDAMLLDIKMPGMDGMEVLKKVVEDHPGVPVIMISGHATISTAVEATKLGAFDFLEKPLDRDRILLTLRNAVFAGKLAAEKASLEKELGKGFELVGESKAIRDLKRDTEKLAPTRASILLLGESGVGKGVVARSIHRQSDRAGERFVEVSCAAIPDDLIESELMGHEKGAFTGASVRKPGKFELADGGTIFLDEIGDMSPRVQAKFLRVLEEQEFERVGGTDTLRVDVRVLAATNKNIPDLIARGEFREDLYFRLNTITINIPPLRERKDDIPLLAKHFIGIYCDMYGLKLKHMEPELLKSLEGHSWPGNVRELRNIMERMVITSSGDSIGPSDLPALCEDIGAPVGDVLGAPTYDEFRKASEKAFLEKHLEANRWNISRTAERLGMQRTSLYKKMSRLGIKPPEKD